MKKWILIVSLAIVVVVGFATASTFVLAKLGQAFFQDFGKTEIFTYDASSFGPEEMEMVKSSTRLSLPASARGLDMKYEASWPDPAFVARVRLPEEAVEDVARQINALEGQSASMSGDLERGLPWWNPGALQIKVRRSLNIGQDYMDLILSKDGEDWILLVSWANT